MISRRLICFVLLVTLSGLGTTVICVAQNNRKPLTNDDIIRMSKKLGENVIITDIETSETQFDTSVDALLKLKDAGISDKVIEAMLKAEADSRRTRITDSSVQSSPSSAKSAPTPKSIPVATQEVEFFTIDIERCSISGSAVVCYFKVTNNGDERHVGFLKDVSELMSYSTNPSKVTTYKFGKASERAWSPIRTVPGDVIYEPAVILKTGSAAGWVRFDGVAPDTQKIGKLIIGFSITGGNSFSVPFRDVPVERANTRPVRTIN